MYSSLSDKASSSKKRSSHTVLASFLRSCIQSLHSMADGSHAHRALFTRRRRVLCTGATRGIGAIALAEAGAGILLVQARTCDGCIDQSQTAANARVFAYHNSKRVVSITKTKDYVEGLGPRARIYTADLSSQDEVSSLTKKVLGDPNDASILLNCASIQQRNSCHLFFQIGLG